MEGYRGFTLVIPPSAMFETVEWSSGIRQFLAWAAQPFLVADGEVVQRLVEELADEHVVADIAPQVLLDDDDRVNQLAQRNALIEPPASPVGELGPRLLRSGVSDPVAETIQELNDALFEILGTDGTEAWRPRVGEQVLRDVRREAGRVDFDELDEFRGYHDELPGGVRL